MSELREQLARIEADGKATAEAVTEVKSNTASTAKDVGELVVLQSRMVELAEANARERVAAVKAKAAADLAAEEHAHQQKMAAEKADADVEKAKWSFRTSAIKSWPAAAAGAVMLIAGVSIFAVQFKWGNMQISGSEIERNIADASDSDDMTLTPPEPDPPVITPDD